jgi:hypothetical protein
VGVLTLGPFVSALLHPFGMALLGWNLARGTLGALGDNWMEVFTSALTYATLAVGYGGTALTMSVGLARRGDRLRGSLFWTIPLYWLLLSLAAWRAVIELIRRPYHWEKTAHGISTRRLPLWSRRLRNSA